MKQASIRLLLYFCSLKHIFYRLKFKTMGRGDKKTKRGKISNGSFGKSRPARQLIRKAALAAKAKPAEAEAGA